MSKFRPLLIDEQSRKVIKEVIDYASRMENRLWDKRIEALRKGLIIPPGENENHQCIVSKMKNKPESGYRCVFSIDQSLEVKDDNPVWARHLSISVSNESYPNVEAVKMLMEEFGFTSTLGDDDVFCYLENEHDPDSLNAINVIQKDYNL